MIGVLFSRCTRNSPTPDAKNSDFLFPSKPVSVTEEIQNYIIRLNIGFAVRYAKLPFPRTEDSNVFIRVAC